MEKIIFDIIVPTYQRYKDLPLFFESNRILQNEAVHLWIIDDCSPDLDIPVIPRWPNLTFIRLDKNQGQAHARNVAIAKGNAPYVISLDDDAWFENGKEAIVILKEQFEKNRLAGCIMFNIATPESGYSNVETGKLLPLHVTCGCAYRRKTLEDIKGFSDFLHSGAEETDLSLLIYKAGWEIRFSNEIKVFHNFIPLNRSVEWYYNVRHNTTRNDLLIVVMRYPAMTVPLFLLGKYFNHLRFAVDNKVGGIYAFFSTARAGLSFLKLLPQAIRHRNALTLSQFKFWRSL